MGKRRKGRRRKNEEKGKRRGVGEGYKETGQLTTVNKEKAP